MYVWYVKHPGLKHCLHVVNKDCVLINSCPYSPRFTERNTIDFSVFPKLYSPVEIPKLFSISLLRAFGKSE